MFNKILVCNRGEIAVRIIRACRELGIKTVAIYSKADENSLHVLLSDEAYCIGKATIKDTYLNEDIILQIALSTNCDAIHPGYGLLSENALFCKRVEDEGLIFIGPSSSHIALLGNKDQAKKLMKENGVPVIEGFEDVNSLDDAKKLCETIGYPVLFKAASGGGGKGIKIVRSVDEVEEKWNASKHEAKTFFKDDRIYIEKYLENVKHVEIQVLCDAFSNVLILGERDCSYQRRKQKLIEETPCIMLTDYMRKKMYSLCKKTLKSIGYKGVGTLEFLLDKEGNFYFMEVNTRLQVEHPVTEFVTGIDLVKWQIRVAAMVSIEKLDANIYGHSIECRILGEDPKLDFLPQSGHINLLIAPSGPFVRFDTFIYSGYDISPYYDSLLGKLIVWDKTREGAIRKMKSALGELVIDGILTTKDYYLDLLDKDVFKDGTYTTEEIDRNGY